MRDKLRALYYPDFWFDYRTFIKSILLFDEIHIMDRPSMTFDGKQLTVGMDSPLRRHEQSFREQGLPFFVHEPPSGPVFLEIRNAVDADLTDRSFMLRFQEGLRSSVHFRNLQIAPGNYGVSGTHETIFQQVSSIDLPDGISIVGVHNDSSILPFDMSSPEGVRKQLVSMAAFCSAKINYALDLSLREGFAPYADMKPYEDLLSAKYKRAFETASAQSRAELAPTDLSLAILDELIPDDVAKAITIDDALKYRKEFDGARGEFLEYLLALKAKLGQIPEGSDYSATIAKIITTEVRPAARAYRNKLDSCWEKLLGKVAGTAVAAAGTAVAWMGSPAAIHILGDITLQKLIGLVAAGAAYVAKEGFEAIVETRSATRDCSLSYLLNLEKGS